MTAMSTPTSEITDALGKRLIAQKRVLTTAESCTGGHIASALCAAENTPLYFGAGFVTFNDVAKEKVLNVRAETLKNATAVSRETVIEMAAGAIQRSGADVSIAVSGYAGPEGGDDGTPAGTVWFAWQLSPAETVSECVHFDGDCEAVIQKATDYALAGLLKLLG